MVSSKLNDSINYKENRTIEDGDLGASSVVYEMEIEDRTIKFVLGKQKYTYSGKNVLYYPIYLLNENRIKAQIGIFELQANKALNILDDDGDVDLNMLEEPLLYSFVSSAFIDKALKPKIVPAKEIEKVVSKNAMIFILPVNYFPEAQGDYYRGLSPYLNSSQLRFTYPVNKGSKALEWQENIQKGIGNNFNKSVELIRKKGFAGIYYDRIAYQQKFNTKDYFESVEKKLAKIPNSKLIKSPDSIYQFVKFE